MEMQDHFRVPRMSPGTGKPPCKREVQHRCASLAKGTTLTTVKKKHVMMVLMRKPNNLCVETSKWWEKVAKHKQLKTPPLCWTRSCRWGTSMHFWLDTGHDLTRISIKRAKWYSEKTVRKPCTLQTITLAPSWSLHALDGHMATRQPWGKNQPSDSLMQIHSCVDPLQIGCKKQWTVLHSSPYRATRLSKSILHILAIMRLFNKYNDTTQYRTIYNTRFLHVHLPFMASMARINCCDQSITSS